MLRLHQPHDDLAEIRVLQRLSNGIVNWTKLVSLGSHDAAAFRVIRRVRHDNLTYLDAGSLVDLYSSVKMVEKRGQPGVLIEAGCALGGSAVVMAAAKRADRQLYVYDTFAVIPPPSANDGDAAHARYAQISTGQADGIGGHTYYGYEADLLGQVTATFQRYGLAPQANSVQLIKGLFQTTLTGTEPVCLAHIDCDWYDSVETCLHNIVPRLVSGGELVIDDYDHWAGCRKAVDIYFAGLQDEFEWQFKSRLHITRKSVRSLP